MAEISTEEEEITTTGRKLVVLTSHSSRASVASALADTKLKMVVASDHGGHVPADAMAQADTILLDEINVLVVSGPSIRAAAAVNALAIHGQIQSVEDEGILYAEGTPGAAGAQHDYLEGYRAGVDALVDHLLDGATPAAEAIAEKDEPGESGGSAQPASATPRVSPPSPSPVPQAPSAVTAARASEPGSTLPPPPPVAASVEGAARETTPMTWGLQAIGVDRARLSGRGVKVAILDTGLDLGHPAFEGRNVVSWSFVPGETIQDRNGHGTHMVGTVCGPRTPTGSPRYGIAYEAEPYVGKVLSNAGSGQDGWVLNGLNWAIAEGCRVVLVSLGSRRMPTDVYRAVGHRALEKNAIIIAPAGNASRRLEGMVAPTGSPGNTQTCFAVAALYESLKVADFSCGGKVELAAPGVNVISAGVMPQITATMTGTSVAASHVAGVAALLVQANPSESARGVWDRLRSGVKRLGAPPADVGAGLVQAPSGPEEPPSAPEHPPAALPLPPGPVHQPPSDGASVDHTPSELLVIVKRDSDIDKVASDLRKAGMVVPKDGGIFRETGVIRGSAPPSQLDAIRAVEGVALVWKAGFVTIGLPESAIQ